MKLFSLISISVLASTLTIIMLQPDVASASANDKDIKDDIGLKFEQRLQDQSRRWFGIKKPLMAAATEADYVPREQAEASERIILAEGLQATYLARNVSYKGDMMSFWPDEENYSHLIICIEENRFEPQAGDALLSGSNSSIQRVNTVTGEVETILYGMDRCDGIRTTAWGTILATEETDDGRAYEIINPLTTTGHWVEDRATGLIRTRVGGNENSSQIVQRQSLPTMAWEGLTVLENGAVIGGDELRPGDREDELGEKIADSDGGAIFKFVPTHLKADATPVSHLSESPLVEGKTYAMQVSCREIGSSSFGQHGQGCEVGHASWIEVDPLNARKDADENEATGYYRPEDLHRDPAFSAHDETPGAVRFCWTNTGREAAAHYGEVLCAVDYNPGSHLPPEVFDLKGKPVYPAVSVNRFFEGDPRFNSIDNLAFQPKTGILYILEDHDNGEIIACLPDGRDRDIKTDGCIGIASVNDPQAEPTGFLFDGTGKTAFVMIQHGEQADSLADGISNPINGQTDDLIKITGFKLPYAR